MYGLKSKKVFSPNECMVVKNLEYCRKLYYNGNRDKDVIWLTALTAKSYREFYDLIIQILNEKNVKKLMEAVVNMNKDEFILHEWQKEKLDALVKYNELEAAKKEGKALGISEGKNLGIIEGENNKTIL